MYVVEVVGQAISGNSSAFNWMSGVGNGGYGTRGTPSQSGGNRRVVISYHVPRTSCTGLPDGVTTLYKFDGITAYQASCLNGAALRAKIDGQQNNWV